MKDVKLITENINLDGVGELEIGWDFDEDDYRDWLSENGLEHNKQSLIAYVGDSVTFEVEYFDNDTYHHMGYDYADYDDMVNTFGEELTYEIIDEIDSNGSYRIETSELYNSEEFDVNNPDELNNIAMKILNHGEYYKGCRGFILTNGVIVYTPAEHNMVSQINGIRGTFDFIKKGNIRILNQSIDLSKQPTPEQREVLRKVIASYSNEELYVDIMDGNGECGSTYVKPDWRYVMGEIDRYFREGVRPQGKINENVNNQLAGFSFDGLPDLMTLWHGDNAVAEYRYCDSTAHPFVIYQGKLYVGDNQETHEQVKGRIQGFEWDSESIDGRIWVKAKSNEFNYAVVSFWGVNISINAKPYIYELADKLNVNPSKIVVVYEADSDLSGDMSEPVLLSDWNGNVHSLSQEEGEQRNIHMMNAKEKHDNTSNFRKSRDSKIGKKLTNDKGVEMPMAQYHNMIYQESKNIVISESQYRRIFKEGASSILYHFLAFDEFAYMINNDCFTPSGAEGDWHNGKNTMSFTRTKSFREGWPALFFSGEEGKSDTWCAIRLTIDGDLMNTKPNFKVDGKQHNMSVKPFDWAYKDHNDGDIFDFADMHGVFAHNGKEWMMKSDDSTTSLLPGGWEMNDKQAHPFSQAEDRLTTYANKIPNATSFILRVDILLIPDEFNDSNIEKRKEMYKILTSSKIKDRVHVYLSLNELEHGINEIDNYGFLLDKN